MSFAYNILITGASSGIGEAIAVECAKRGAHRLYLCARNKERLDAVAEKCRALGTEVRADVIDVADRETTENWIKSCDADGKIEVAFSNAGIATGPETSENIRRTFDVNLGGGLNVVLPVIDLFRENGGEGRNRRQIVITSSMTAYGPLPTCPSYAASKAALKNWGLSLRGMLKREGIMVNVICPGFIRSRITERNTCPMPFIMDADKAAQKILKRVEKNVGLISFPWPMRLTAWWISSLPWCIGELVSSLFPEKS